MDTGRSGDRGSAATWVLGILALLALSVLPIWSYRGYASVKSALAATKEKIGVAEARIKRLTENLPLVKTVPLNVKALERAKVLWVASLYPDDQGVPKLFDSQATCGGRWTGLEIQSGDELAPLKISERSCSWSGMSAFFAISFLVPDVDPTTPTIFIGAWSNKEHVTGDSIELR